MSKHVKVKLNYKGLLELWKDTAIHDVVNETADKIADIAGDGYRASHWTGQHRGGASVWINSEEALQDNFENNTLLKAVGQVVPANKINQ